jgi:hypothetical protein
MDGLMRLRRPEQVAEMRGLSVKEVLGLHLETEGATEKAGNGAPPPVDPVAVATEAEPAAETDPEPPQDDSS